MRQETQLSEQDISDILAGLEVLEKNYHHAGSSYSGDASRVNTLWNRLLSELGSDGIVELENVPLRHSGDVSGEFIDAVETQVQELVNLDLEDGTDA